MQFMCYSKFIHSFVHSLSRLFAHSLRSLVYLFHDLLLKNNVFSSDYILSNYVDLSGNKELEST